MTAEPAPEKSVLEVHEEFVQHIEAGSRKIRTLSIITILVTLYLAASYVLQLATPYLTNTSSVTVNLLDPGLQVSELVLLALFLVWLYVATRDYLFTRRLTLAIKELRQQEREIEKRITG